MVDSLLRPSYMMSYYNSVSPYLSKFLPLVSCIFNTIRSLLQSRYNVPRSFLKPTGNQLVILEEETGNPIGISLDSISITKTCGQVSESHYPLVASWMMGARKQGASGMKNGSRRPKVRLSCPTKKNISNILFASFGTPSGDCQSYSIGMCHSPNSRAIVENVSFFLKHISILQRKWH